MDDNELNAEEYLLDMLADIDRRHQEARQPIIDELEKIQAIRMKPCLPEIFISENSIDSLNIKIMDVKQ